MTWTIKGRPVLVTGGNSGIGRSIATALATEGAQVTITVRDADKGTEAASSIKEATGADVEFMLLDLADLASVKRFAAAYTSAHNDLAVLVNNAGGIFGRKRTTADGFEMTMGTNHLGPFLLTKLLLPLLEQSAPSRVVNVASSGHAFAKDGIMFEDLMFDDRRYDIRTAYGQSKLANILHARELNRRYAGDGVTAYAVHPGVVSTGFGQGDAILVSLGMRLFRRRFRTPDEGAETAVFVAIDESVTDNAGGYFEDNAPTRSSRHAKDDEQALRLWEVSELLISSSNR